MRDYLILIIILVSLPIGLIRPYYGILVYAWVSYMYPQMWAWSFAQNFPVAKFAALSALVGAVVSRAPNFAILRERENISMVFLWGTFTLSSVFALYQKEAWIEWQNVSKLMVMALLTSTLLTDRKKIKYFLIVVALSLGFYGIKGGIFSLVTGGTQMVWGPGTSIIGANNAIGLALNMCLPILWYLSTLERGILKRLLQGAFFLTIPAVMFTYSRASAITLAIVLVAMIMKQRYAVPIFVVAIIGVMLASPMIPRRWFNRQQSTLDYEDDGSAMSRIENWKFCWLVAVNNPLVGVGFEFQRRPVFEKYAPQFLQKFGRAFNTHNIYLAILASHGFPALGLFLSMIGFCFFSTLRMKKATRGHPELKWVSTYCDIIQVSLLAFLLNGGFVNMEYFDLPYHLVGVTAAMMYVTRRSLAEDAIEQQATGELVPAAAV